MHQQNYYHKYKKYKQKYLFIKGGHEPQYYFHGSPTLINDYLEPRSSQVIDNESAVFATNTRWIALLSIAKTKNDFEFGFINSKPYILENEPGRFQTLLTGLNGYIYYVYKNSFHSDKRLGMPGHEFVSSDKVKIIKTEQINDVYDALLKTDVALIKFDDKIDCIENIINKQKSNDD